MKKRIRKSLGNHDVHLADESTAYLNIKDELFSSAWDLSIESTLVLHVPFALGILEELEREDEIDEEQMKLLTIIRDASSLGIDDLIIEREENVCIS